MNDDQILAYSSDLLKVSELLAAAMNDVRSSYANKHFARMRGLFDHASVIIRVMRNLQQGDTTTTDDAILLSTIRFTLQTRPPPQAAPDAVPLPRETESAG